MYERPRSNQINQFTLCTEITCRPTIVRHGSFLDGLSEPTWRAIISET